MTPEQSIEAADIARRAADHVARVGWTNDYDRWDEAQEAEGTPRGECRVTVIGALAQAAYGNPGARISFHGGAADEARVTVLDLLTGASGVPSTAFSPEPALRDAAVALENRAHRAQ